MTSNDIKSDQILIPIKLMIMQSIRINKDIKSSHMKNDNQISKIFTIFTFQLKQTQAIPNSIIVYLFLTIELE